MPTLSDRLKTLGVKIGTADLPPPAPRRHRGRPIEDVIPGRTVETRLGETYVVESVYPAEFRQGQIGLRTTAPLQALARWAGEERICDCAPQAFAFLDTETTGLSGGTGTYAFMVGIGRFEQDEFHLAQFFMRDPAEEPAQLAAIEQFLAPCETVVTYNGKAFDVPLLATRYLTHGWQPPLTGTAHVDLLHLARRLWRDRLPSRTLGNIEVQILGARRTEEDVPGWDIPRLYFEYLRDGDSQPLKNVFYHNAMDILSLAALFNHTAGLLADPMNGTVTFGVDLIALAKLFEDLGDQPAATRLYLHSLDHEDARTQRLPESALLEAIQRLALIYKRQDNLPAAIELWEQAARREHLPSHMELAKAYEHRLRDTATALYWTNAAIALVTKPGFPAYERRQWLPDLKHRLHRLQRKLATHNGD